MKKSIISVIVLLLQGCNDSDINEVKSLTYGYDESITLGNLLDHRTVCNNTSWREFTDVQGRDVVEYRCDLKGADQYSTAQRNVNIKALENHKSPYRSQRQTATENNGNYFSEKDRERTISWANDALQRIDNDIKSLNEKPLATRITQIFQWGVVKNNKPVLMNTEYDVELQDKSHKVFNTMTNQQLEYGLRQAYDLKIVNYSQLVSEGYIFGNVPRWPFQNN